MSAPATREPASSRRTKSRAFRGLFLVFILSFLNLVGILFTVTALGGTEPWTGMQFIALFGALEAASGLANIVVPNVWRLPIAQANMPRSIEVKLAASALLLPHWGGAARTAAGCVLMAAAGVSEGVSLGTAGFVVLLPAVALSQMALSLLVARIGVQRPDLDVVQIVIRRPGHDDIEPAPLSIGASLIQFLLSIITVPFVKLLPPSVLFQPELAPSPGFLLASSVAAALLCAAVAAIWRGHIEYRAPRAQQREAEQNA